jgi:UDP-glucose 4-epimerase
MEEKMSSSIITGGAGFIGSHLTDRLLYNLDFDKIYLIDNLIRTDNLRNINHLLKNDRVEFIESDISKFDFSKFVDRDITHLFHLAAPRINRCAKNNSEGHKSIADGGFNVVDYCSKNNVKLFFSSTASVYQKPKILPVKENIACYPHTIYGAGKLYTENLIKSYDNMYGLDYTINRFFSVYGVRMDNKGAYTEVIFNWLNSIKNGNNELTVFGNPDEKVLDLVYIDDVIDTILLTTFNSNKEIFNVSTEIGITLTDLIKCISKVTDIDVKVNIVSENRNDIENKRVGSVTKLKKLGWNMNIDMEAGIRKTWEWINE